MTVFDRTVHRLVGRIPPGRVATYGQIAALLGVPRAARAVGSALKRLRAGSPVPWHRVINARGGISLRANLAGMLSQRLLLEREGVRFASERVSLARYRWRGPRRQPLRSLRVLERL